MKKHELLEEIVKLDIEVSENFPHYDLVDKEAVLALINQLEEPEVLSQEWIDGHAQGGCDEWVYTEDLENLLVPKQEKPVIPKFVADYYNDYKDQGFIFAEWFEFPEFGQEGKTADKTFEWLLDNSNEVNIERQFILADIIAHGLDGYELEKEKRFYAKIKGWQLLSRQHLTYFNYDTQEEKFLLSIKKDSDIIKTKFTKEEWAEFGINDTNADFEEVTE